MEKFLKDRCTIEEVSEFLSEGNVGRKKRIYEHLGWVYGAEIFNLLLDLRSRKGCEDYGMEQAIAHFKMNRDEALRYGDNLTIEVSDSKPQKRGRPESHAQVEKNIEIALAPYKGKKYSQSQLIKFVADKLEKSTGTLDRHYKKCFSTKKNRAKKP